MFFKRVQPFQLGFTDWEVQIVLKVFSGEELTDPEDRRADHMLQTMRTQYERLRVKRNDDYRRDDSRDEENDDRRNSDDGPLTSYDDRAVMSYSNVNKHDEKRDEKTYTVPPEATKPARRAVRTSR